MLLGFSQALEPLSYFGKLLRPRSERGLGNRDMHAAETRFTAFDSS